MFFKRKVDTQDLEYISDAHAASLEATHVPMQIILWLAALFTTLAVLWAYNSEIEEITRGEGKVISSSNLQKIQNLEGGILEALLVEEGQIVEQDQILMIIDDTKFLSSFKEGEVKALHLKIKANRLEAESLGEDLVYTIDLEYAYPELVEAEKKLFKSRKSELKIREDILKNQIKEKEQELIQINQKQKQLEKSYALVKKELELTKPLVAKGAVSEVEILRLQRTENDLKGELDSNTLAIPKVKASVEAAENRIKELSLTFKAEAREELNEVKAQLSGINESNVALADRVARTEVRAPVKGTVNKINITTIGGIIQPGEQVLEIVPLNDSLLIEAEIRPSDIGFLRYGLNATVKLTAYDFSIYGGLKATVEHISPNTIMNEKKESMYLIRLQTEKNFLMKGKKRYEIIPGMRASVDIITGNKSILDYIMKPILKTKDKALTER